MQDSRINYTIVGAFVSAMLAGMIVVAAFLSGGALSTDKYFTVYDNVSGLKPGTAVLYEGYQIGEVSSIEPRAVGEEGRYRLNLTVEAGWEIPEDSVARAAVPGILSALAIDIKAGDSSTVLTPGSEIEGAPPANLFGAIADIGSEFGNLSQNGLMPLLDNLNTYISGLGDAAMETAPDILNNLKTVSDDLAVKVPSITADLQQAANLVTSDVLSEGNRGNINAILNNLDSTTAEVDEFAKTLRGISTSLTETLDSVNRVVVDNETDINDTVDDLRYTLNTVSRYVDGIASNLETTSRNFAEFSRAIRDNPSLLISGSPPDDAATLPGGN